MQIVDLFSGIGGFSLAGRWMGWETVQFCEIDPFCQRVLSHHFPGVPISNDVKQLTADEIKKNGNWHPSRPTIVVGGFPCQPFSAAGKRKGTADDRHLWPEMLRIIRDVQPDYVVGENVGGLLNWSGGLVFDQVQADLEAAGYEVTSFVIPAAGVNAPHRRDRVWIVAKNTISTGTGCECGEACYKRRETCEDRGESIRQTHREVGSSRIDTASADGATPDTDQQRHTPCGTGEEPEGCGCGNDGEQKTGCEQTERIDGLSGLQRDAANTTSQRYEPQHQDRPKEFPTQERSSIYGRSGDCINKPSNWSDFPTQPPVCGRNDGISSGLVDITLPKWRNESIKALGNAIVPQVAYQIFKAIVDKF